MIEDAHLDDDAKEALSDRRSVLREIETHDGRRYSRRVEPYPGDIGGVIVTYEPIVDGINKQHKASENLSDLGYSEIVQSLTASVSEIGVWTYSTENSDISWDSRSTKILGLSSANAAEDQADFWNSIDAEDRALFRSAIDATINTGSSLDLELRRRPNESEAIWLRMRGERLEPIESGGQPTVVGILTDFTESAESQNRSDFMMRELDHRVKNLLAIILSIAEISARSNSDLESYKNDFRARLESMARTHNLLAQTQWAGPQLRSLIEEELFHHAAKTAVSLEGPTVDLTPGAAQSLAMFFHELAANALKHGALSRRGGQIDVSWQISASGSPVLELFWQESGGPTVRKPSRDGFGGKVINRIIGRQLDADVRTQWNGNGIRLNATIPLDKITA